MRARSRRLQLAGAEVETPLLVPGFSSKALGPITLGRAHAKGRIVAASEAHTDMFVRAIDEALLVSAYDIHHGLIADAAAFVEDFARSPYAEPRLLIIDSGWYEKSVGPASGQWYHEVGDALTFAKDDYLNLVARFDAGVSGLLVSWDDEDEQTYLEQIEAAQDFFAARQRLGSTLLLKPEHSRLYHDFAGTSEAVARRFRSFDVIGVTEKDLGDKVLNRLTTLAQLRDQLDAADVSAPIHVFGGLEPLFTPLYFMAGAEIFDGLAWLRYAFRDGLSFYRDAAPLLDGNIEKRLPVAIARVQLDNLDALVELSRELKVFLHNDCDFAKLRQGRLLEPTYQAMESALGRRDHGR
jgi:hypothetical protein